MKQPIGRCPRCRELLYEPFCDHDTRCPESPYRNVIVRGIPREKEPEYDHETKEV